MISSKFRCVFIMCCILASILEAFEEQQQFLNHTIELSMLSHSPVCNNYSKANERQSTVPVVDKYGPCHKFNTNAGGTPIGDGFAGFDSENFVASVGLGTPQKQVSLVVDTGSDLTWTQCEPCADKGCYEQQETMFNRDASSTYANVSSDSPYCTEEYVQPPGEGKPPNAGTTCRYKIKYADGSKTVGLFAKEKLALTRTDKIPNFLFGCGLQQSGKFDREAGMLGLNREEASIVSQTMSKYNGIFSYCLPEPHETGHLAFGKQNIPDNVKYTPLSLNPAVKDYYGVNLLEIHLGGTKLNIPRSVLKNPGTIIDSGSILTFLPKKANEILQTEFRKKMSAYDNYLRPYGEMDTCYDLSKFKEVTVPQLSFVFQDLELNIPSKQILYFERRSKLYCLHVTKNHEDDDVSIIGNVLHKTMEVVINIPDKKVGFGSKGC